MLIIILFQILSLYLWGVIKFTTLLVYVDDRGKRYKLEKLKWYSWFIYFFILKQIKK